MEQANEPAVLVTGCGSGIGATSARLLAERGFRVFASLRDTGQAPLELLPRERFQ